MNEKWKQDPRLKGMDSQKLKYFTDLASQVDGTPKDKLMPLLMSLAAGNGGMNFTDQETELMVSILTANMNSAQKKQVEMLRTLSQQMGKKGRKGPGPGQQSNGQNRGK